MFRPEQLDGNAALTDAVNERTRLLRRSASAPGIAAPGIVRTAPTLSLFPRVAGGVSSVNNHSPEINAALHDISHTFTIPGGRATNLPDEARSVSPPTSLADALARANATQNLDGTVNVGPFTVDHHGVHGPYELKHWVRRSGEERHQEPYSMTRFSSWMGGGFIVALVSGMSGYSGAFKRYGRAMGIASAAGTSALNYDGFIQFFFYMLDKGLKCDCSLILLLLVAIVAAGPSMALAMFGVIDAIWGDGASDDLTPERIGIGAGIFAPDNGAISSALNMASFVHLKPNLVKYYRRIGYSFHTDPNSQWAQAPDNQWNNTYIETMARCLCFIAFFPAVYCAMMASIARGQGGYQLLQKYIGDGYSYELFILCALPGFAMFLTGLLKLILFIESVIKFVVTKLFYRHRTSFSGKDIIFNTLAISIAIGLAELAFANYEGLADTAHTYDWLLVDIIQQIITFFKFSYESGFLYPVCMGASSHLLMRADNFSKYFRNMYNCAKLKYTNPEELAKQRQSAEWVSVEYKKLYAENERSFATFLAAVAEYFSRRGVAQPAFATTPTTHRTSTIFT